MQNKFHFTTEYLAYSLVAKNHIMTDEILVFITVWKFWHSCIM